VGGVLDEGHNMLYWQGEKWKKYVWNAASLNVERPEMKSKQQGINKLNPV
jgi:hypothetical protein